ncbi:uncharacterized beta-barrel protein YwiB (DUF1934 family) [Clostridium tetanomorphum]|uniref:DUF1934 domain-containing protein n=1 Tax=Clostridium tetanomorphum TaxID=1553 RepID=A0A923EAD0_CLOTT|nr:DUF1934 domain-containing protein [Clostridium tetanomorphum]KAJ53283.1 hypothetical protein CTM_03294 [Clostridium tetanomorphum DSM 665]MBC2399403.1 DUF1934 domain-containing protein [Clostridium tetanomorphum]MBP1865685.1 uncharacterized beta-barrel protein YwiB (DUF1934 family) [Clostridium tetanomorphum]NRS86805.1 uncharacterized beta-barrel protein YwiB (DUF1934 family) [Clostridium tetanomorphum]NRZ99437.1 uncharacterized beta-barrel protein YwiB (DUF1934 family) [Clostridium tetanom
MKKKALISVSSIQSKKKEDTIEVVTPGDFYKKENCYYVVYNETEISGMEGTTTTFRINSQDNKFSLIRMGTTSTKMEFEEKKDNTILYNTPYGTLELKLDTKKLDIDVNDEGGNVTINYNMGVSGQKPQNTILKITIKAQ